MRFLFWIGLYNAVGSLFVFTFLWPGVAQRVLGKGGIEVVEGKYDHGTHGPLWVFWAAGINVAVGLIMVLATRWPVEAQREVATVVVAGYAAMAVAALRALRSPHYKRLGITTALILWAAQISWGVVSVVS